VEHRVEIPEVEVFDQRYERRYKLWNNRHNFSEAQKRWYDDNFEEQDAIKIVKDVKFYESENIMAKMKLKKGEKDDVLFAFEQEVKEVVEHCALIEALGCKDLEQRHWNRIFARMDSSLQGMHTRDLTLTRMLQDNALEHQEYIQEIAGLAKGEADLNRQMKVVKDRWAVREFTVV